MAQSEMGEKGPGSPCFGVVAALEHFPERALALRAITIVTGALGAHVARQCGAVDLSEHSNLLKSIGLASSPGAGHQFIIIYFWK